MSVLIYGIDNNSENFHTIAVSSEKSFYSIWQPLIDELGLKLIGDQRWLYKKDLKAIITEFQKLLDYARENKHLYDITYHTEIIIANLEKNWDESAPNAERLWMG